MLRNVYFLDFINNKYIECSSFFVYFYVAFDGKVAIEKGEIVALKSKVYPTTENQSVTWESSDPTIVKVASSGKIKAALAEEFDVYDLNGRKVLNKATSLDGLSDGVYIINGKKVLRQ